MLSNQNYDAASIYVICSSGTRLLEIQGLTLGRRYRRTFRTRGCTEIGFIVRSAGRKYYRYPFLTPIGPDRIVCLVLQPAIAQSYATDCTRYAP